MAPSVDAEATFSSTDAVIIAVVAVIAIFLFFAFCILVRGNKKGQHTLHTKHGGIHSQAHINSVQYTSTKTGQNEYVQNPSYQGSQLPLYLINDGQHPNSTTSPSQVSTASARTPTAAAKSVRANDGQFDNAISVSDTGGQANTFVHSSL